MQRITVIKDRNFTVMSNVHLKDERLSWKAKGFLSYILSLPENWELFLEHLKTVSKDGKDSTSGAIKELIKFGYMTRVKKKAIGGKFSGYSYTVFENPSRIKSDGDSVTDFPSQVKTNESKTNQLKTNGDFKSEGSLFPEEDHEIEVEKEKKKSDLYYEFETISNKKTVKLKIAGLFKESNDLYSKFMETKKLKAVFGAGAGRAMKEIIVYFIDLILQSNKDKDFTQDEMKKKVLLSFQHLYFNWNKLEKFHQEQLKLVQINSNLVNIINQVINESGSKKRTNNQERKDSLWSSSVRGDEVVDYLNE